jgi:2-polyprenyl-3-methyl-5-hydroxy-6-metoxy-1,4-benzoquinol methylase
MALIANFADGDVRAWWPRHIDESAWLEHTPFAAWLMGALSPRTFVELGTHRAVSYMAFCQAATLMANPPGCFAVDTWRGDEHTGSYEDKIFNSVKSLNEKYYANFSTLIRSKFSECLSKFEDKSVDLLHIDGFHTYEAVSDDFNTWLPKMSDRGVVLFHDIAVRERDFGVWKLWDEVTQKYPHFSFLHGYGLGVLAVGNNLPAELRSLVLLQDGSSDFNQVRDCFQSLGARVSKVYAERLDVGRRQVFPDGKFVLDQPSRIPREDLLLAGANKDWKILEIGPMHRPAAAKKSGWKTTVIDHASKEGLIEKYKDDKSVGLSQIEDVDFVWQGQNLAKLIPQEMHGRFDLLIASHVIEHLPDPIGVLLAAETLLRPDSGIVSLAVPDKRLCFDFFRPLSTTGKFLAAYDESRVRHSKADIFDSVAYLAMLGPDTSWGWRATQDVKPVYSLEDAYERFRKAGVTIEQDYEDCHGWTFTPASFELLILELSALGILDWRVQSVFPQSGVEFIVHLARGKAIYESAEEIHRKRLDLLKKIQMESHQQTQFYVEKHPDSLRALGQEYCREIWRKTVPIPVREKVAAIRRAIRPGKQA